MGLQLTKTQVLTINFTYFLSGLIGLSFSARKGGGARQEGNEAMEQADRRG